MTPERVKQIEEWLDEGGLDYFDMVDLVHELLDGIKEHMPEFAISPLSIVRLSVVGGHCKYCNEVMGEPLKCPGCGWVDPPTVGS